MATDLRASASLILAGLAARGQTNCPASITSTGDTNISNRNCPGWAARIRRIKGLSRMDDFEQSVVEYYRRHIGRHWEGAPPFTSWLGRPHRFRGSGFRGGRLVVARNGQSTGLLHGGVQAAIMETSSA
jgi:hypothetical protein